jgi:hypothetical protein
VLSSPRARRLAVAAIALVAAAWFWSGIWLTLEWVDQGQIVYGVWRVARGELPYRDFDHMYGPSLFFLNGALMRAFGEDLGVLRMSLLAVKVLLAGLLFVTCRAVARASIAALVTGWFVAQWGAPLWIFATPYAGHYTLACCLAGLAVLLRQPAGGWRAALVAGLLVGVGATFKHTTGVFVALGALVVLASRPAPTDARDGLAGIARALRAALGLCTAVVIVGYLLPTLETWTGALLMGPPLLALVMEWRRDLPLERTLRAGRPRVTSTLAFGAGFAVPLATWAAVYAAQGALGDLGHDLLFGLPPRVHWFVTLEAVHPLTLCLATALATGAAGLVFSRPALVAVAGFVSAALFIAGAYVPGWGVLSLQATRFLPIALVWVTAPLALGRGDRDASRLLWWFAAMVCLSLYPSSDLLHALMIQPAVLPLLALLVEEGWALGRTALARVGVAMLVGSLLLARAGPDVASLVRTVAERPAAPAGFDRARGIWDPAPKFEAMHRVVDRLDAAAPRGTPLLALPSDQLLYVLADRPSALPHAEFIFYLLAIDAIGVDDARALLSEEELVSRTASLRPIIVRSPDAGWTRIATAFPELRAWVDRHYELIGTTDNVQVLVPRDRSSGSGGQRAS